MNVVDFEEISLQDTKLAKNTASTVISPWAFHLRIRVILRVTGAKRFGRLGSVIPITTIPTF
jgi:hypothetical protein